MTAASAAITAADFDGLPACNAEVTRQNLAHLAAVERRAPERWVPWLRRTYRDTLHRAGHRQANLAAGEVWQALQTAGASAADDDELRTKAKAYARRCTLATLGKPWDRARELVEKRTRAAGVPEPDGDHDEAATRRGRDELWWRRQLRTVQGRAVEVAARRMGMICRAGQIYASDEAVSRRQGQRRRNRSMLEEVRAINEQGQDYSLAELADLSVSNPALRRGELMVRIRGTEEVAEGADHLAAFFTITAPSRFHAVHQSGAVNERWDGSTPRDAHQYLRKVWEKTRAAWHRQGLEPYGVRVAEPHHDGTPHWHLLLFMPADQARDVARTLREKALADTPDEPGAQRHRYTVEWIDPEQGSAVGYIAKYVAKNIDGHALGEDLYGTDAEEAAQRIDAWAATWGIRQFQFMGTPPVGIWRELRRLDGAPAGPLGRAYAAADAGNWRAFAEEVAKAPGLEVAKEPGGVNKYGEQRQAQPVGVLWNGTVYRTRRHIWATGRAGEVTRPPYPTRPQRKREPGPFWEFGAKGHALAAAMDYAKGAKHGMGNRGEAVGMGGGLARPVVRGRPGRGGVDSLAGGAAAGPWTGVNNCTRGGSDGGLEPPAGREARDGPVSGGAGRGPGGGEVGLERAASDTDMGPGLSGMRGQTE